MEVHTVVLNQEFINQENIKLLAVPRGFQFVGPVPGAFILLGAEIVKTIRHPNKS